MEYSPDNDDDAKSKKKKHKRRCRSSSSRSDTTSDYSSVAEHERFEKIAGRGGDRPRGSAGNIPDYMWSHNAEDTRHPAILQVGNGIYSENDQNGEIAGAMRDLMESMIGEDENPKRPN